MKLAFYRAAKGTLFSKLIAWFTRPGGYSHVELVFPEWSGAFPPDMDIREHDAGGTLCFSSAENDGGTRFKILDLNDGKWDFAPIALDYAKALAWCIRHQHLAYDWRGLRGFVFPWEKPDPKDLFCSECAIECSQDQQLFLQLVAGKTSPNTLARAVGLLT
ncbi:MAG: hypothetical protein M3O20_02085 [Acidobacteriota bacterium]|nr:hypothetical protein [Acidobacteriota bacterium]